MRGPRFVASFLEEAGFELLIPVRGTEKGKGVGPLDPVDPCARPPLPSPERRFERRAKRGGGPVRQISVLSSG